jgi:hypothetical protein
MTEDNLAATCYDLGQLLVSRKPTLVEAVRAATTLTRHVITTMPIAKAVKDDLSARLEAISQEAQAAAQAAILKDPRDGQNWTRI